VPSSSTSSVTISPVSPEAADEALARVSSSIRLEAMLLVAPRRVAVVQSEHLPKEGRG